MDVNERKPDLVRSGAVFFASSFLYFVIKYFSLRVLSRELEDENENAVPYPMLVSEMKVPVFWRSYMSSLK